MTASDPPIRVLLADDQSLVRMGLRLVLDNDEGIRVVGEAGDGDAAVELCRKLGPDVALLDVQMPRASGLEATQRILAETDGTRVIILTTFDLDEYVVRHEALLYRMEVGDLHWLAVVAAK